MILSPLTAISPVDGRYHEALKHLSAYFSESALIRYRLLVEVEYFNFLSEKKFFSIPKNVRQNLRDLIANFNEEDALAVKTLERITNHDVKAVEYFLKQNLTEWGAENISEWVHFGLTSQDINNTAVPMLWKDAMECEILPAILNLQQQLKKMAAQWKDVPMLARTHGQPASPVTVGREFMVFVSRLESQIELISYIPHSGKFGGATGGFNAHHAAFPKYDWNAFADEFLENILCIQRQPFTTQIEHYDNLAAFFDNLKRINNILIDCCRDIWTYISMDYFSQTVNKDEVGSSAMPHKVNPIDFENAEGNLGLANAMFEHLASKLPVSRLQRDLTDSTVLRNIGLPAAQTLLAIRSLEKGLGKIRLNEPKIREDLENNWAVVAEGIQTILRRENYPNPYEALKQLTRGNKVTKKSIHAFIDKLKVSAKVKKELKSISPATYVGKV